jgi:hypothetical protein
MNKFLYFAVVLLRIIFPPLIFIYPLISIIVSFFLDVIDIEFASSKVLTLSEYEQNDKLLDFWWYLNAIIYSWYQVPKVRFFLLILFAYRLIGQAIFFIKKDRRIFFIFPNFFENFFFLYFFADYFPFLKELINNHFFLISLLLIFFKFFQEWWVHIAQISIPEDFFNKKRRWRK